MGDDKDSGGEGPGSSSALPAEELDARVWTDAPGIIVMRGVPSSTADAVAALFARAEHLAQDVPTPILVVDLSEAGVPDAATRALIRRRIEEIGFHHVSLTFQDNTLLQIVARFILASVALTKFSVHSTVEEAIEAAKEERRSSCPD